MAIDLNPIIEHDMTDDCPACRTQELVQMALLPAANAWELTNGLPRFAMALYGAAGLLGTLLEEGVPRDAVEAALSRLMDDVEQQIAEDKLIGGPPQGTA